MNRQFCFNVFNYQEVYGALQGCVCVCLCLCVCVCLYVTGTNECVVDSV